VRDVAVVDTSAAGAPGDAAARRSARWILLIAALPGAGTMAVEIAAVRVLAPWFGTSLVVWTNVLEVILLGLALGYLAGSRLAAGDRALLHLGWVLAAAGLATAVLPAVADDVCGQFLPAGLALEEAASLLLWGSLAAASVLFLPLAVLLGMAGPLAVEEVQLRSGVHAGTAGGRVLAASTLGSVLGAFATSHFALPELGIARSFHVAGGALLLAALGVLVLARRRRPVALVAALLASLPLWAAELWIPAQPEGVRELERAESVYQSLRVVEDARYDVTYRYLQVNEGFDSYQSVWRAEPGLIGEGFYYDDFALPPLWSGVGSGETWRATLRKPVTSSDSRAA